MLSLRFVPDGDSGHLVECTLEATIEPTLF